MSTPSNPRYELFSRGIFVDPMVDVRAMRGLAASLYPRESGFPLIRIGGDQDGGYLVPDDLGGLLACFSPGVDQVASFETSLYQRGIPSHLADASVEAPPSGTPFKTFARKFLGASTAGEFISLEDWVSTLEPDAIEDSLILQMDIEGGEYDTLLACPMATLRKFRIMVVEFHNIESWSQKDFFGIVRSLFKKLLSEFAVVHSHPNNACGIVNMNGFLAPRVFELTFLRRTRSTFGQATRLPHALDRPNIPRLPPLEFPADWMPQ
ncbi:MAG: hypothetical protein FGM40_00240 [Rhodocyclaceae bacterium]|nr:hypothetical protein [Rhodocyclaceae bacterium]